MAESRLLELIQFIVLSANRAGYPSLWTIHLVKYLYIADLFNARSEGETLTNWNWKFWNFGPWCTQSYRGVEQAVKNGFIQTRNYKSQRLNEEDEFMTFHCDLSSFSDSEFEALGKKVIPNPRVRMGLESIIKSFGPKTNPLLNYVYNRTEPMMGVKKGDTLDFVGVAWPEPARRIDNPIKKRKIKKAKEVLEKIKNMKTATYKPPKGSYDELYLKSMSLLDLDDTVGEDDSVLEGYANVKNVALAD